MVTAPTIANILQACFSAVKDAKLRNRTWVSDELEQAQQDGRIEIHAIGPAALHNGKGYEIQELSVPVRWDVVDDTRSKFKQVEFISKLCSEALNSHDLFLITKLVPGVQLIASQHYRYDLSGVVEHGSTRYAKIFTAFAVVPSEQL